jgi:hypothetical protein
MSILQAVSDTVPDMIDIDPNTSNLLQLLLDQSRVDTRENRKVCHLFLVFIEPEVLR